MRILHLKRTRSALVVTSMLMGLAAGAPAFNATATVPRSVFLTLPDTLPEPQITLTARQLETGHWRLAIMASEFRFTDLCVSDARAIPVGHAHISLDGIKIAAAYQPYVDLAPLPPGRHRLTVMLRGQDHRALVGRDGLIMAQIMLDVVPENQP